MRIRLDQIVDEPHDFRETRELELEALDLPDVVRLGPVSWRGQVAPVNDGHLFRARLEYEQELACTRCLGPARERVESEVELLVVRGGSEPLAGEHELDESDFGVLHLDEDAEELDTDPILMEQLQLNVPMRALCREDCAGLCPECGADRNVKDCGCDTRETDPRWAALARLRGEQAD